MELVTTAEEFDLSSSINVLSELDLTTVIKDPSFPIFMRKNLLFPTSGEYSTISGKAKVVQQLFHMLPPLSIPLQNVILSEVSCVAKDCPRDPVPVLTTVDKLVVGLVMKFQTKDFGPEVPCMDNLYALPVKVESLHTKGKGWKQIIVKVTDSRVTFNAGDSTDTNTALKILGIDNDCDNIGTVYINDVPLVNRILNDIVNQNNDFVASTDVVVEIKYRRALIGKTSAGKNIVISAFHIEYDSLVHEGCIFDTDMDDINNVAIVFPKISSTPIWWSKSPKEMKFKPQTNFCSDKSLQNKTVYHLLTLLIYMHCMRNSLDIGVEDIVPIIKGDYIFPEKMGNLKSQFEIGGIKLDMVIPRGNHYINTSDNRRVLELHFWVYMAYGVCHMLSKFKSEASVLYGIQCDIKMENLKNSIQGGQKKGKQTTEERRLTNSWTELKKLSPQLVGGLPLFCDHKDFIEGKADTHIKLDHVFMIDALDDRIDLVTRNSIREKNQIDDALAMEVFKSWLIQIIQLKSYSHQRSFPEGGRLGKRKKDQEMPPPKRRTGESSATLRAELTSTMQQIKTVIDGGI